MVTITIRELILYVINVMLVNLEQLAESDDSATCNHQAGEMDQL